MIDRAQILLQDAPFLINQLCPDFGCEGHDPATDTKLPRMFRQGIFASSGYRAWHLHILAEEAEISTARAKITTVAPSEYVDAMVPCFESTNAAIVDVSNRVQALGNQFGAFTSVVAATMSANTTAMCQLASVLGAVVPSSVPLMVPALQQLQLLPSLPSPIPPAAIPNPTSFNPRFYDGCGLGDPRSADRACRLRRQRTPRCSVPLPSPSRRPLRFSLSWESARRLKDLDRCLRRWQLGLQRLRLRPKLRLRRRSARGVSSSRTSKLKVDLGAKLDGIDLVWCNGREEGWVGCQHTSFPLSNRSRRCGRSGPWA